MTRQFIEVVTDFLPGFKTGVSFSNFIANYKLQKSGMISKDLKRAFKLIFTIPSRVAYKILQPYQICFYFLISKALMMGDGSPFIFTIHT